MESESDDRIRLDKWLKVARIYKTRSQATEGCEQGRVTVNDQIAKPAKLVKPGDRITVRTKMHKRILDVLGVEHRSVSAENARHLYHEHPPTPEEIEAEELKRMFFKSMKQKYKGRPTKRDRRDIRKLRGY